jgi:signal peptidase I
VTVTQDPSTAPEAPKPAPKPKAPVKRRSVGNVKAAAGMLIKEARRILKKHAARLAPAPADAIRQSMVDLERYREARQWERAEDECERLDELLHQHASFARKSPLRETIENVGIAVMVALALRSCLYEPFKIPSGSMMPTLRSGDHIFVNKFAYGIQIPFTTTVVGEFMGAPQRGDVIVFRYPVDESEDFIKRVIGLPGDTVRVEGNKVSIKRAGAAEFEELARKKLPEKCLDESGTEQVPHCELFEESLDGRTYVVRYLTSSDPRVGAQRRFGEWRVPERHYLVMGDNRNQSHDSLAWTKQVEAVAADGLLSVKDLRDLTPEKLFTLVRPDEASAREDSSYDHIVYMADHASDAHGLQLEIWRDPVLGAAAVFETLAEQLGPEARRGEFSSLYAGNERLAQPANKATAERLARAGEGVAAVAHARGEVHHTAAVHLAGASAVMRLRCGVAVCGSPTQLADKLAEVIERWDRDRSQDARQVLEGDREVRYSQHWTSRGPTADKFVERAFQAPNLKPRSEPGPAQVVRLRAWRAPDEPLELLRDAALRAAGTSRAAAKQVMDESGEDAWLAGDEQKFTFVRVDAKAQVVFVLECGRQRCTSDTEALTVAGVVQARVPTASKDRSRLPELLRASDLGPENGGWKELAGRAAPERYEYDRMRLDGSIRDGAYSLGLWVWRKPAEGLEGKVQALVAELGATADEGVARGGFSGPTPVGKGRTHVFPVPATESVIRVDCSQGLCPGDDAARAVANRAYQKAQEAANFVDPTAERPRPYVPRGNVKGRADRIWLPLGRFWLPIR